MADKNKIGARGESIFMTRITQFDIVEGFFLGDKAPIVDFYLDIVEGRESYQFLVQVKSTNRGYDSKGDLKISVPKNKYTKLQKKKLPTYIAGVDIKTETVYLCSAFQTSKVISSMPTKYCLKQSRPASSKKTLEWLKDDVIGYWKGAMAKDYKNKIKSKL